MSQLSFFSRETEEQWKSDGIAIALDSNDNSIIVSRGVIYTPDDPKFRMTGEIELTIRLAASAYIIDNQLLIGKWLAAGNQRSFSWIVSNTGILRFQVTPDGIAASIVVYSATLPLPYNPNQEVELRVVFNPNNGVNSTVNFYTRLSESDSWTPFGAQIVNAPITIFQGIAPIGIGAFTDFAQPLRAKIFNAKIYSDGILVGCMDPNDIQTDPIGLVPPYEISTMSSNLILRSDPDGSLWGKISRLSVPPKLGEAIPGSLYINGIKYTVSSFEFVKILPL